MNVLELRYNEETDTNFLEFHGGSYESSNNYVRACCESNYHVEFNYRGFDFSEALITRALTDYFNDLNSPIDSDNFHAMFEDHSNHINDDEMTEIKKICLNYMRRILFDS